MKTLILILLGIVMLFLIIFGASSAYQKSDPEVSPEPSRNFARIVVLLDRSKSMDKTKSMDETKSMNEGQLKRAKQILKTSVIENCGPGDELIVSTIGPVCERDEPIIAAQLDLPGGITRDNFEKNLASRKAYKINELADKIASRSGSLEEQRAAWSRKVDDIQIHPDDGSDYTRQLEQAKSILARDDDTKVEKVLIVLGDLTEDLGIYGSCKSAPKSFNEPTPPTGPQAFRSVRLELVCTDNRVWVQNKNDEHWRSYFGNNKLAPTMFSSVESGARLLSPNPMVELKRIDNLPSFWEAFWPYLLAILGCAVLFIVILTYDWWIWPAPDDSAALDNAKEVAQEARLTPATSNDKVRLRNEGLENGE